MQAPKSELVSRAGVHYAGYVFSTEGMIFRETSSTDVGVDGQLELVSAHGKATGMLVGVQVKSGDSFVDSESGIFSFKAGKAHFEYWQNLRIPVIGVVYTPKLKTACWFDLTKHADQIIKGHSSRVIKQQLSQNNTLEIGQTLNELVALTHRYYKTPVNRNELDELDFTHAQLPEDYLSLKEDSWKRLISIFFHSDSGSEVVGEVGYRLSWYFPTVSELQKKQFKRRLLDLTPEELNRVILAIKLALQRDRDDVATLLLDLISYTPEIVRLFDELDELGLVSPKDRWLLQQSKDYLKNDNT